MMVLFLLLAKRKIRTVGWHHIKSCCCCYTDTRNISYTLLYWTIRFIFAEKSYPLQWISIWQWLIEIVETSAEKQIYLVIISIVPPQVGAFFVVSSTKKPIRALSSGLGRIDNIECVVLFPNHLTWHAISALINCETQLKANPARSDISHVMTKSDCDYKFMWSTQD